MYGIIVVIIIISIVFMVAIMNKKKKSKMTDVPKKYKNPQKNTIKDRIIETANLLNKEFEKL